MKAFKNMPAKGWSHAKGGHSAPGGKKIIILAVLALFISCGAWLVTANMEASAKTSPASGDIIKGKGLSTLYYLGEDGKRYVFPNAKTYFSWFENFENITEIDLDELSQYPLGKNVRYKPGVLLVKIQTNPEVYVVTRNGILRSVKSEQNAVKLYGANWNLLVDDIPDSFFGNYVIGDPVEDEYDPDDEEEQAPTVGHNIGFKLKKIEKHLNKTNNVCARLQKSINKIQKRLARYGILKENIGTDYLEQCAEADSGEENGGDDSSSSSDGKKVTLCHIPPGNPNNAKTISVGAAASKAHLAHGDTIGTCEGEEPPDDDTTPPVISDIDVINIGTSTATITWTTDEESDSTVEYADENLATASTTTVIIDGSMVTSHSTELSELRPWETYYFIVKSADSENNLATSSESSFSTFDVYIKPDTTAPVISNIQTTIGSTTATITWDTDEDSTSKITYATESLATATTTEEVIDSTLTTSHSLELTDLATSTEYYYRVESEDASNNTATSTEDTFTTL
jgi:hypothetical protein